MFIITIYYIIGTMKNDTDLYIFVLKGTIHLFRKSQRSFVGKLLQEFRLVAADRRVSCFYSLT